MPDNNPNRGQGNQYDKILKENLEVTLPVIIREVLGIEVAEIEELPDDIQHTKERKPDVLKKITTVNGETFILQIEFQVKSEEELVYRMAEYSIMLMRKYKLPVRQYVIFLRKRRPSMAVSIDTEHLKFSYPLLLISEMNYRLFLNSENPEVKMLAILADFANT
ncbi:Rpn family recombination-promoting nuclease/putative transposase, partial [Pararcticibacter amylolyticus]